MENIICPHCGKKVELSEAIIHQLSAQVRDEEGKKLKAAFEKETKEKDNKLQELAKNLESEQKERKKVEAKIKEDAKKEAEDEIRLKLKEKDIQIDQIKKANDDIRRANEDLKRKLEQGSQQMQGEALEQNLEEKLKSIFQNDEFLPIPKGIEGGDIWQKVKFNGKIVGSILWETKRTKAWSKAWLTKLKDDAGKISASESILVSQVLPEDIKTFDRLEGVWITNYELAINICRYVRYLITAISKSKSSISHSDEEWAKLRDYILSNDFKHRMRLHFESVKILKDSINSEEKRAKLRWRSQRTLLDKLDNNTYDFYVDLKNIVPNLPEIENLEPTQLESNTQGDDENTETLF